MNRRGFSLIELLIVIVMIGVIASFGYPSVRRGLERQRVAGARVAIATMNAKARALAVQRSRAVSLVVNGNTVLVVSRQPVTGALDTVDNRNLYTVHGVTLGTSRDTLRYDPRGLGLQNSSTTITITRPGGYADTLVITSLGGIQQ